MDLQLLPQCGSTYTCLSRSVPEIHSHVAGTLSNQQANKQERMRRGLLHSKQIFLERLTGVTLLQCKPVWQMDEGRAGYCLSTG